MSFILKKLGKRTLSIICAAAILISCVTVGFGSLAGTNGAVAPYTVDMASPAIPMTALTSINLDNIDVIFPGDSTATDGTEINWVADASASIIRLTDTTLVAYSKGVAALTATKKSGGEAVTIYAVIKNAADTEWVIYEKTFGEESYKNLAYVDPDGVDSTAISSSNRVNTGSRMNDYITYNGTKISATNKVDFPSGWASYFTGYASYTYDANGFATAGSGGFGFHEYPSVMPYVNKLSGRNVNKGIVPFENAFLLGYRNAPQYPKNFNSYFVLDNEVVNAFTNYTINTDMNGYGAAVANSDEEQISVGVIGRVKLDANGKLVPSNASSLNGLTVRLSKYDKDDGSADVLKSTVTSTGGSSYTLVTGSKGDTLWDYVQEKHPHYYTKFAQGVSLNLSVKYEGNKATLFSNLDTNGETFTISAEETNGTIAVALTGQGTPNTYYRNSNWVSVNTIKVALNNNPNNPEDYPAYSTDLGAYVVTNESPAIPMNAGTMISVSDLLIEDNEGNLIDGANLKFENVSGEDNAIVIDNAAGTITAYKKGAFKVKVTKGSTEVATLYVVVKLLSDTEWVIYEKTFGEESYKNLAYVDPDGVDSTAISSSNRVNTGSRMNDYITYNGTKISATNKVAFPSGWASYFTGYASYTYDSNGVATGSSGGFGFHEYPSVMPYVNNLSGRNVNKGIVPFENACLLGYRNAAQYPKNFNSYFVLDNEIVNDFANYTINADMNAYGASASDEGEEQVAVGLVGRVKLDASGKLVANNASSLNTLIVRLGRYDLANGNAAVFNTTLSSTGAATYTLVNGSNGDTIWDYVQDMHPHFYTQFAKGLSLNLSVKYDGSTATLFSNRDTKGETFTMASTEEKGAIAVALTGQGTPNTYYRNSSWVSVNTVKVTLNNGDGNCPKYVDLGIYSVTEDEPAIPMYAGSYISTTSFSIAAAGDVYMGNTVKLENVSGQNGIEIDNTLGRITAYKKGAYEVAVKDASTNALITTVYVIVKNKGDATWDIYSIEFGEEEYKNLTYVDPDNIHTKYKWDNTSYLGDEANDYIAYNGNKVTSAANGVAFPTGWSSYFTKYDKSGLGTFPTVMPYENFVTGRVAATSGIVPFETPGRIGLDSVPYASGKQVLAFNQANGYFILNDKIVNSFANYTVTTNLNNYMCYGGEDGNGARFTVGIVGRVQYDSEGNVPTDASASFNGFTVNPGDKQIGTSGIVYVHSGLASGGTGNTAATDKYWDYLTGLNQNSSTGQPKGVNMTLRTTFEGDTMSLSSPLDKDGKVFTAANAKQKGGIGITLTGLSYWEGTRRTSWVNVKTVTVSLNNVDGECPEYTSFKYFVSADSPYIYGTVGDEILKSDVVVEIGGNFYVGDTVTWSANTSAVTVQNDKIVLNTKGTAQVTVRKGLTQSAKITFAIKGEGEEFFSNGNYKFTEDGGALTIISPLDASTPFSTEINVPDRLELEGGLHTNIYGVGANFGANSGAYNANIEKLSFGKYIEYIGEGAFANATALKQIELSERLIEIGANAFKNTALERVVIPARVDKIGDGAFAGCASLTEIYISNPDIEIGSGAFSVNTVVYGPAAIEAAVIAAGGKFSELGSDELSAAAQIRANILTIEANRINVVDTEAIWFFEDNGKYGVYIQNVIAGNRDAGKYIVESYMEAVNMKTGKKELANTNMLVDAFKNSPDAHRILSIEVREGVSSYNKVFMNLTSLVEFKAHSGYVIGHQMFAGCTSLKKIEIPAGTYRVGLDAFTGCTSLEEIIFAENSQVSRLGCNAMLESPRAFINGTAVETIKLPVTVDIITPALFKDTNLKHIYITNRDCEFSGEGAFFPYGATIYGVKGSTAEAMVELDKTYKTENTSAYRALTFVAIDDFYVTQSGKVDANTTFKVELTENGHYAITGYIGVGGKVIFPAAANATDGVKNAPVYEISSNLFYSADGDMQGGIKRLIQVEISEGIAEIGENAFKGAAYMESIKLPNSLKVIGKTAFATSGLKGTVEVPKNVTEIGAGAFQGAKDVTDIYIYNANTVIKGNAFEKTVKLHGIKGSTAEAYATANGMEFVEIPAPSKETVSDVSDNGNYTFTIENGIITGYTRTDENKPYSRKVVIPATVNGEKVTAIGEGIFEAGAEATSVYAVVISKGITEIGNNAFLNAKGLTLVDFGSVTTIGDSAFEGTSLIGDVVFSESIASVGKNAFKGLKGINSITVLNDACVLKANSIPRVTNTFVLYGNTGSTAEQFANTYKINFEYLDGGPAEEPGEEPGEENPNNGENNVGDKIEAPSDSEQNNETVVQVAEQLDLTLIIVIAAAVILLVLVLGAGVVVVLVIKSRADDEDDDDDDDDEEEDEE